MRTQILAHRRTVQALETRLPKSVESLRQAAWAGLQDSMPRAALLSIHARVEGTGPDAWQDASLVQLWGPRFNLYAVAARDRAAFSLGRLPEDSDARQAVERLAARLNAFLAGRTVTYGDAARALGEHPYRLRYAAMTGTVLTQWDGARQPVVHTAAAPEVDRRDARLDLARRHLHVFGPTTPERFSEWAGIARFEGTAAFEALRPSLTPVRTPVGDGWILTDDEPIFRDTNRPAAAARLLPSGDAYYLAFGEERQLLVMAAKRHRELWTPRVWPGCLLVAGEIAGTWRRTQGTVAVVPWRRLSRPERDAIEAEAESFPLPGIRGSIRLAWHA